jgi:tRNA(adenine34) deaminase
MSARARAVPDEQDVQFMQLALWQAEAAVARGQTPFGAVVVDARRQVIGEGHNTVRSSLDPTAHAEVVAIREAWRRVGTWQRLRDSTLYSTCEPCLLCSFVITQIGFSRVLFAARGTDVPGYKPLLGADLGKAAEWVNGQPDWTPLEVIGDFMREQALQLIAVFPWAQAHTRGAVGPEG